MKITSISAQSKNPDRVNISVDGKYRFSLDIYQVVDLGIKVGNEYSEAELAELETESQFGKLYARALEYCLMRPHSSREVRDYLYRKTLPTRYRKKGSSFNRGDKSANRIIEKPGVSQEIADRIFNRLAEKGYVDDEKFARWWIENRNQRKGTSLRKLEAELRAKGVDPKIIAAELQESSRDEQSELEKVIAKKRSRYDDPQKFKQYLMRQGFSYDAINAALEKDED